MNGSMCHLSVTKLQASVDIMRYYEWPKVKKYLNKQIHKAVVAGKAHANNAKNFVESIETKKWPIRKKVRKAVYTVNRDPDNPEDEDDDEYLSWGSDFDEEGSIDSLTTCSGNEEKDNEEDGDVVDVGVDDEDDNVRCTSYSFIENGRASSSSSSSVQRSHREVESVTSSQYENTYETISETPSASSYGGSSENSSSFYETPSEGTSRGEETDINHHDNLSGYSDVIRKEPSEVLSETSSSGLGSEPSPKVRARSLKKPAIPPKPSMSMRSQMIRGKMVKKFARPPEGPPPPPPPPPPLLLKSSTSLTSSGSPDKSASNLPTYSSRAKLTESTTTPKSNSESKISEIEFTLEDLNEALDQHQHQRQNQNQNQHQHQHQHQHQNPSPSSSVSSSLRQEFGKESIANRRQKEESQIYETPIYVTKANSSTSTASSKSTSSSGISGCQRITRTDESESTLPTQELVSLPVSPPPQFAGDQYCCSCKRSLGSTPNLRVDGSQSETSSWLNRARNQFLSSTLSLISPSDVDRPKLPRSKTENQHHNFSGKVSSLTEKAKHNKWLLSHRSFNSLKSESSESHYNDTHNAKSTTISNKKSPHHSLLNFAQRLLPPLADREHENCNALDSYDWFHNIERETAVNMLKKLSIDGAYVVRPSKRAGQSNPLSLSLYHQGKVLNLNIRKRPDNMYALGKEKEKEMTFITVPDLVNYHQSEPIILTINGESAGVTKLTSSLPKKQVYNV